MYQYMCIVVSLMALHHIVVTCSTTCFTITTNVVTFQIYRSIVCTIMSIISFVIITMNWDGSPFTTSPMIHIVNKTMIGIFATDLVLMGYYQNKKIELWIHHVFCLLTYIIMVEYFEHSNITLLMIAIGESLEILSGVDAVSVDTVLVNAYSVETVLVNTVSNNLQIITNLYQMMIIIFIRFPAWLYVAHVVVHPASPLAMRLNGIFGIYIMVNLDAHWFKKCYHYLKKQNICI